MIKLHFKHAYVQWEFAWVSWGDYSSHLNEFLYNCKSSPNWVSIELGIQVSWLPTGFVCMHAAAVVVAAAAAAVAAAAVVVAAAAVHVVTIDCAEARGAQVRPRMVFQARLPDRALNSFRVAESTNWQVLLSSETSTQVVCGCSCISSGATLTNKITFTVQTESVARVQK